MKLWIPTHQNKYLVHTWFAWHPVIAQGENEKKCLVWLEPVLRRREAGYWSYVTK